MIGETKPMGLLFIPEVIYEHGDHGLMMSTGKFLIRPAELCLEILAADSSSSKVGGTGEGNHEFGLAKYFCSYLKVIFTCREILRNGTSGFTSPPKEGVLRIFMALKSPSPSVGFEPANLGSSGKHANH
jgi:hypothetical protein